MRGLSLLLLLTLAVQPFFYLSNVSASGGTEFTPSGTVIDSCDDYTSRSSCENDYDNVGPCDWDKACSWDDPTIGGPRCQGTPINPTDSQGNPHLVNCGSYGNQSDCVGDTHGKCSEGKK